MSEATTPQGTAAPVDHERYMNPRERDDDRRMRASMARHVADYRTLGVGADRVELLTWGRPDTGVNRVHYLSHGPRLFVAGDMGDAVYTREAGLAWWASLYPNFRYFAEKCDASDAGSGGRAYDPDAVRDAVRDHFADAARDAREDYRHGRGRRQFRESRAAWRDYDGDAAVDNRYEWMMWLHRHGAEAFGPDWWDSSALGGMVVSFRTRFHLLGLHLAMAQIAARAPRASSAGFSCQATWGNCAAAPEHMCYGVLGHAPPCLCACGAMRPAASGGAP